MTNYPNQPPYGSPPSPYNAPMGGPPGGGYSMPAQQGSNGSAVAALIFGILGCVPLLTGLLAVIFGIMGIRRAGKVYKGKGLAVAGLVLGLLSLLAWGGIFAGGGAVWWATKANRAIATQYINTVSAGTVGDSADGAYSITQSDVDDFKSSAGTSSVTDVTTLVTVVENDAAEMSGLVTFANGEAKPWHMRQKKENGQWKVTLFEIVDQRPSTTKKK